ncbi:hypothetical protein GCM10027269_71690 [Kribbella endophytica]
MMRAYLLTAPRWVLCLLYGLPFGAVFRAARRGPVPADSEVRAAALRVAERDSSKAILGAVIGVPFAVLMIVAVFSHRYGSARPLFVTLAVLLVVVITYQVYQWRHLKRRVQLLTPADDLV